MTNRSTPSIEDDDEEDVCYLGDPDVVAGLVGGFAARVEGIFCAVKAGQMSGAAAKESLSADIRAMADRVTGRSGEWTIIKGYHDFTLGNKLAADLSEFRNGGGSTFYDDPVAVLFDWLAAIIMEKLKLADGDDMLLEVMLRPSIQYAVKVILGIEERQGGE